MHKDNEKFMMLVYMSLNQKEINVNSPNDLFYEIRSSCSCGTSKNNSDIKKKQIESTETTIREGSDAANDSYSRTKHKKKERNKDYMTTLL